jgi:predicted acyl esterase
MRGRFREGFDHGVAFVPGQPAVVKFSLPDVNHTFRRGHRLMVQVQSTWFPLFDRNPQTFVDIATADEDDFRVATETLHRSASMPSSLVLPVVRGALR